MGRFRPPSSRLEVASHYCDDCRKSLGAGFPSSFSAFKRRIFYWRVSREAVYAAASRLILPESLSAFESGWHGCHHGGLRRNGTDVARGQVVAPMAVQSDDQTPPPSSFALLKADSKTIDLIDDFKRYSEKKSWELAFHSLGAIDETKSYGACRPATAFSSRYALRIQQLLLRMPPEGRDAYRLFNDAGAKQLWQRLQETHGTLPSDEAETLQKLVGRYFLTSVGDLAADRLGDLLFEQGDFSNAEGEWRTIVEKYPDPHLPLAKLQCKRCVALSLMGRHSSLAEVAAQVREKYGDQNVTIGGREVNAADFCESLLSKNLAPARSSTSRQSMIEPEELNLPSVDEPLWQISITGPDLNGQTDPQTGWPLAKSSLGGPPWGAVDAAQKRFYANIFGIVYAADLETGKMLWRTAKFNNLTQQVMQAMQTGIANADAYFVCALACQTAGRLGRLEEHARAIKEIPRRQPMAYGLSRPGDGENDMELSPRRADGRCTSVRDRRFHLCRRTRGKQLDATAVHPADQRRYRLVSVARHTAKFAELAR